MSDARHIDDRPALPLPRVLQVIGNVQRGKFLAFADETGKRVVAMEATSDAELANAINELKGLINSVGTQTHNHEVDTKNPHRVKASQLTERATGAGSLLVEFNDVNQGLSGSFNFAFDPSMYNEGALSFTLNVGEYAPPMIAGKTLTYNGNVHLAFFSNGSPVFVTESTIEGVYFYVSTIHIATTEANYTLLFFMVGGSQDAQSISDVTPFGDVLAAYATSHTYISSGTYQVLTESMFRDKVTGKAYAICVENGELKLQEYRATKYEA